MFRLLKIASTLVLVAGLTACKGDDEEEDTNSGGIYLNVNLTPTTINDQGQTTSVRVTARDAKGEDGTGEVTLTAAAGSFDNDSKSVTLTLSGGKASSNFRCVRSQDTGCQLTVSISAEWGEESDVTVLQVVSQTVTDAGTGTTDGGTTDAGTTDAGTNATPPGPPANLVYQSASTLAQLGIRSSNLDTSSPVTFVVVDLNQRPVPGVTVFFDVRGVGGAIVAPVSAVTDKDGKATTTLQSGDEVGIATVRASVANPALTAISLGTPIVGARPSDEGFVVECTRINLAANATETPPRQDLSTDCTAQLVDRFRNPVTLKTSVSWYSEAGSIGSPVSTGGGGTGGGTPGGTQGDGKVVTKFSTAGKWPPSEVTPLTGEPSNGARNPRDMLVTVIAVTSGEEAFYDGSGVTDGVKNGKWDVGEWFVDVPEPFVDENDNQVYDRGEPFIDTERLSCTTGQREAKNGRWDGPNGCWDGDIQIWRATHILYSGFSTIIGSAQAVNLPPDNTTVAKNTSRTYVLRVSDAYLNPISPDSAKIEASLDTTKGKAEIIAIDPLLNSRHYGVSLAHQLQETQTSASTPGYIFSGACDPSKSVAAGSTADKARCMRRYVLSTFRSGNTATLRLSGAPSTDQTLSESGMLNVDYANAYSGVTFQVPVTIN